MTLMLMSAALWADETITVSANSSDISEGLDLKVVAKLFAEAKNLEEFETMLNNPDSAFCNLDLNGDGQVDYLRVVETGEGNKRLIVLQAILAKDIYQDVASIYVEKDAADNVSVQVIGDEYVYGANYIIEPVYVYRPVIYDWFWGPYWCAWNSPWYWGYYPSWWYVHSCWAHDWYWHHCYAFHHCHHYCSFRPGRVVCSGYRELRSGVTRREFADAHPERSFSQRNSGMTNAREIRSTSSVRQRQAAVSSGSARSSIGNSAQRSELNRQSAVSRTYGSTNTAVARSQATTRSTSAQATGRAESATRSTSVTTRSTGSQATTRTTSATTTRTTTATASRSTGSNSGSAKSSATTRSTSSTTVARQPQRSTGSTATRSTSSITSRSTSSTYSSGSRTSSSGSSTRSSGSTYSGSTYSGSRGGGYSGGSRSGGNYGGGGSRGGGGGGGSRRR